MMQAMSQLMRVLCACGGASRMMQCLEPATVVFLVACIDDNLVRRVDGIHADAEGMTGSLRLGLTDLCASLRQV